MRTSLGFIVVVLPVAIGQATFNERCGSQNGLSCARSTYGLCCSRYNFCGISAAHCGTGCQSRFGFCDSSGKPPVIRVSTDGTCGGTTRQTCLNSRFGNCCSPNGWCGSTTAYCGQGCNSSFGTCNGRPSPSPVVTPRISTPAVPSPSRPVSTNGRCGPQFLGQTCVGFQYGECCSQWSYCGRSSDHCNAGCQQGFGKCSGSVSSLLSTTLLTSSRSSVISSSGASSTSSHTSSSSSLSTSSSRVSSPSSSSASPSATPSTQCLPDPVGTLPTGFCLRVISGEKTGQIIKKSDAPLYVKPLSGNFFQDVFFDLDANGQVVGPQGVLAVTDDTRGEQAQVNQVSPALFSRFPNLAVLKCIVAAGNKLQCRTCSTRFTRNTFRPGDYDILYIDAAPERLYYPPVEFGIFTGSGCSSPELSTPTPSPSVLSSSSIMPSPVTSLSASASASPNAQCLPDPVGSLPIDFCLRVVTPGLDKTGQFLKLAGSSVKVQPFEYDSRYTDAVFNLDSKGQLTTAGGIVSALAYSDGSGLSFVQAATPGDFQIYPQLQPLKCIIRSENKLHCATCTGSTQNIFKTSGSEQLFWDSITPRTYFDATEFGIFTGEACRVPDLPIASPSVASSTLISTSVVPSPTISSSLVVTPSSSASSSAQPVETPATQCIAPYEGSDLLSFCLKVTTPDIPQTGHVVVTAGNDLNVVPLSAGLRDVAIFEIDEYSRLVGASGSLLIVSPDSASPLGQVKNLNSINGVQEGVTIRCNIKVGNTLRCATCSDRYLRTTLRVQDGSNALYIDAQSASRGGYTALEFGYFTGNACTPPESPSPSPIVASSSSSSSILSSSSASPTPEPTPEPTPTPTPQPSCVTPNRLTASNFCLKLISPQKFVNNAVRSANDRVLFIGADSKFDRIVVFFSIGTDGRVCRTNNADRCLATTQSTIENAQVRALIPSEGNGDPVEPLTCKIIPGSILRCSICAGGLAHTFFRTSVSNGILSIDTQPTRAGTETLDLGVFFGADCV